MRILHISDTHFFDRDHSEERLIRVAQIAQRTMERFHIDLCIHTGDILHRNQRDKNYEIYLRNWPSCLHVPGNHDNPNGMKSLFPEFKTGFPYVIKRNGIQFIGLDSSSSILGEEQLSRLSRILSKGMPCIILLHHQIAPLGKSWLDRHVLKDFRDFQKVLMNHHGNICAVFHGHFHHRHSYLSKNISIFSGASAAYQYSPWDTPKTILSPIGEISVYEITDELKVSYVESIFIDEE